jgi:hypothetical protein
MARKRSVAGAARKAKPPRASALPVAVKLPLAHTRLVHGFLVRLPPRASLSLVVRRLEPPFAGPSGMRTPLREIEAALRELVHAEREGPTDDAIFH